MKLSFWILAMIVLPLGRAQRAPHSMILPMCQAGPVALCESEQGYEEGILTRIGAMEHCEGCERSRIVGSSRNDHIDAVVFCR